MKEIKTCHPKYASIDIWDQCSLLCGVVLCITEYSSCIPGSTVWMPVASPLSSHEKQ